MNRDTFASIIFAVSCFVFFWLVVPQYDMILDIRAAISGQQKILEERTALRENVIKLMSQYNSRKNDVDKLILLLPKGERYDQIIENVRAATSQNGLQMSSVQVSKESKITQEQYEKTFVKIDINGNYDSLLNLLKDLEKSLRLSDITEIQISQDQRTGQVGTSFNISLNLTVYNIK